MLTTIKVQVFTHLQSLSPAANLLPVSLTPVANLPPVLTTQGELVAKFASGVVDTGGKFAAGVVDTGSNLPPVSLTPVANLPPVSLTPVVHLDLRISQQIFEKIWNDPNVIIRGLGEGDSWKNLKQKILWHCPFNMVSGMVRSESRWLPLEAWRHNLESWRSPGALEAHPWSWKNVDAHLVGPAVYFRTSGLNLELEDVVVDPGAHPWP